MNKIILNHDGFIDNTSSSIVCSFLSNVMFDVSTLIINVNDNSDLEINYDFGILTKLEVVINVKNGVKLNIYEFLSGNNGKLRTKYYLESNAVVNTYKFNDIDTIKEYVITYLNGSGASINYNLKTIAKNPEKYDILIYHNDTNTNSVIIGNGVNINGSIDINVSSFVKKGCKDCYVNQNNRIINLTNNECIIKPNLYIDEADVSANHSALIGNFSFEELFYLMSRGINHDNAMKLLIRGFLMNNFSVMEDRVTDIINKYWR